MLTTVLFDMGGTLEDIWYNEDTQRATCRRLLEVLRANGLEPGCPDDVFWKRITDGVKAYKQWSEGNMLEKKPEEIWPDWYLRDFAFDREKLLEFNKIHPTFDENRLVVKPNPVTVPTGPVTPWEERKRQFVFAGRLEELKGLRTVIEAWRILGKDAPLLLVAGDGPLADWAKAQDLPKVQFVGQLPRDALHRLMAESRAVVAASLCYESFALVPAEAHALGTPVLASSIGNVGASVRPGFDGLCFAPGDPAALAGAVRAMSAMQFDCTAIANATRRRFSAEEKYKTLLKLYGRRAAEEVS